LLGIALYRQNCLGLIRWLFAEILGGTYFRQDWVKYSRQADFSFDYRDLHFRPVRKSGPAALTPIPRTPECDVDADKPHLGW
jgi:hypothetical protein